MKRFFTQFFGILAGCLLLNTGFAQLSATESSDANELIELFLNDNGNLTYSNATLIGAEGASGTYMNADFGASEGVILSTGVVVDAAGPNNSMATTTVNGVAGDDDLEQLTDQSTNDAVSLSADFVAEGSNISFSYLFASEDYSAYVCSPFSDVMAVFVDGGEYDNQNIALVPGTDLLVTSNTINSGSIEDNIWSEEGCPEGGLDNSAYYVDNEGGLNHEYNGRTISLEGEFTVTPGESYTIRWVIADGGDALFDSALLLEAGSLSSSDSECTAVGGELTVDGPTTVCKSDGIDDSFTLQVEGAEGENQVFVATFLNG
ncbi:choice-of-anchor L domain-containing protein, partial [Cryomorphaceae bacterium 1068]|nr:choice-of-anchor L domain-containing protein [Cryomorphaceae bacterium 1068]